ncbi:uncharacterized protein PRCAT00006194001 [Priceomyces carsonii]|uniref:uncharacterized protein n=1 Tax=Priceomyces carsonii TaxID=28549 RepID=UPI002ED9A5BF|nr:unnamed protein product [Priceomyces carsonii]
MYNNKDIAPEEDHEDSDMVDAYRAEDVEETTNGIERQEQNIEASDNDSEDESLRRMSEQARRRRNFGEAIERETELEDFDEGTMDPADFLRRLLRARSSTRSAEAPDDDNEDDDGDDGRSDDPRSGFLRALGALSSERPGEPERGQGFVDVMQRLMGGGVLFGGRENSEMEGLINNLNQREDTFIILETLNELSERLLMMNGITAERVIPANKLAKSLINIMEDPQLAEELELHLVACRCLYNFLEVNQDFIHDALNNGAVEVLCGKLLEISFIDLTEQALQTLEMISRDPISHNQIIINNGLKACLQYLDFLTIHAQRKCMIIVANACSSIRISNFELVREVFDNLSDFVRMHNDSVVAENGWLAISRIIMSFKMKPEFMEQLFDGKDSLLKELTEIIYVSCNKSQNSDDTSKTPLSYGTCISLIKSLIVLVSVSVKISRILLESCSIGDLIVKSLNKYSRAPHIDEPIETITSKSSIDNILIEALMAAPKELLSQLLTLIGYLLPIAYDSTDIQLFQKYESYEEKEQVNSDRIKLCRDIIPDSYWKFVNEVWSLLINSFQATMDYEIRRKVLVNLLRIISFSKELDFRKIHGVEMVTGLLASVVHQSRSSLSKFSNAEEDIDMQDSDADQLEEEGVDTDFGSSGLDNDLEEEMNSLEDEHEDVDSVFEDDDQEIGGDLEDDVNNVDSDGDAVSGFENADRDDTSNEEGQNKERNLNRRIRIDGHRKPYEPEEDTVMMNSKKLLLSTFLLSQNLLRKAPNLFVKDFEREGLINDTFTILSQLKGSLKDLDVEDLGGFSNIHGNKFTDLEVTKDAFSRFSSRRLCSEIKNVGSRIENLYIDLKASDIPSNIPENMKLLNEVKTTLNDKNAIAEYDYEGWKSMWIKLKTLLIGDGSDFHISSFELITSGIIDVLADLFTSDDNDFGFEFSECYKAFVSTFFVNTQKDSSVSHLVKKLQEALTRSESFQIISSGGPTSIFPRFQREKSQTAAMAGQVKLRVISEDTKMDKIPDSIENMVLSVHAIATFKSVETFLQQRIKFLEGWDDGSDNENINTLEDEAPLEEQKDAIIQQGFEIEFLINGEVIPNETTIYGAVYKYLQGNSDNTVDSSQIWSKIHNVNFRKVLPSSSKEPKPLSYNLSVNGSELDIYDKTTSSILNLLKILFEMNAFVKSNLSYGDSISNDLFMNWKLTVKFNRQLEEPLVVASGTLPSWSIHITKNYSFLFPLDTRIFFMQSTSFGYSRLIHQWQLRTSQENEDLNQNNGNGPNNYGLQLGRPTRHKVRLSRKMILQSALKVLNMYGSTPGILEIEYFDEVGSGLGPTLEFYATVSKEFAKKRLKLWRDLDTTNKDDEDYVTSKTGLFPAPLDKNQASLENGRKVMYFFNSLGKFIARALLDSRIIDFNFNPVFLKLVQFLNQKGSNKSPSKELKKIANLPCLRLVDPELANSLEHLLKYIKQFSHVEESQRKNIEIDGATLEDLSLSFVLPGYPEYNLIPKGEDIPVTVDNVEQFVSKVLEATLYTGILHQTKAFMEGFSKVFPIKSLAIFSAEELVKLFGSAEEDWSFETLNAAIFANHGYTKDSEAIKHLISILVDFDKVERSFFLQFLTGAPKLPIGGFKALRPELTVVRKQPEDNLKDDDYLPSVMTCANYLKLPNYSSQVLMKERLLQAIHEGAGAFLLS